MSESPNPLRQETGGSPQGKPGRYWTYAQAHPNPAFLSIIIILALETAMRQGEILHLKWENVNLQKRIAHLPETKNGSKRDTDKGVYAGKILFANDRLAVQSIARNQAVIHLVENWETKPGKDASVWITYQDGKATIKPRQKDRDHSLAR